jgi:carbon-monoxide dehydrogenase catalytic subunit
VTALLAGGLQDVVGAKFAVEPDPEKAALLIRRHIESKRKALGLPHLEIAA